MSFCVYILRSLKNGSYYKGSTCNVSHRFEQHNNKKVRSTSRYVPWELVCVIKKGSRNEAIILERKLKNITGRQKLESFIRKYSDAHVL